MSDELEKLGSYVGSLPPVSQERLDSGRTSLEEAMNFEAVGTARPSSRAGRGFWTNRGDLRPRRLRWVLVATVIVVLVGSITGALLAGHAPTRHSAAGVGATDHRVLVKLVSDDVSVTIASGSYNMTFNDTATPPTKCSAQDGVGTPTTGEVGAPTTVEGGAQQPCLASPWATTSGYGTVDTNPYAMVAVSHYGSTGVVTTYDNGTDVWEFGGGDYGLNGPGQAGPGAPLSGYAGSVEGSVGLQAGALDMQALASTTGYLDLEATEIQGAQPAGTGTVDGVPVTIYQLSMSGLQDPNLAGLSAEQVKTIRAADAILQETGFSGKTVLVSVDAKGYVHEVKTSYTLSDGSVVTGDTVLSNFGCAGTVLMPGQSGSSSPPVGCVSPDTAAPAESTTTTQPTTPASSTTSTSSPTSTASTPTSVTTSTTTQTPTTGQLTIVPNVIGESVAQAEALLSAAGFESKTQSQSTPSGMAAGTVVAESPGAGSRVAPGSTVELTISSG